MAIAACVVSALIMFVPQVAAQMPSDADIVAEQARLGAMRAVVPVVGTRPNTFPIPLLPPRMASADGMLDVPGIDLQKMVTQYRERLVLQPKEALYVFVSFAMPEASLRRAMAQAHRAGATVVIRGFKNNSWRDTALALEAFKRAAGTQKGDGPDAQVSVDPALFTRHAIKTVPAVMLSIPRRGLVVGQAVLAGSSVEVADIVVSGDVSLDYALAYIAGHAPAFSSAATRFRTRL